MNQILHALYFVVYNHSTSVLCIKGSFKKLKTDTALPKIEPSKTTNQQTMFILSLFLTSFPAASATGYEWVTKALGSITVNKVQENLTPYTSLTSHKSFVSTHYTPGRAVPLSNTPQPEVTVFNSKYSSSLLWRPRLNKIQRFHHLESFHEPAYF